MRALPKSAEGTRLSGSITLIDRTQLQTIRSMPAVRVRIVGEGRTVELQTNAQGVFERYGLPPGEYRVEPVLSDGLRVYSQRILGVPDSQHWELGRMRLPPDANVSIDFAVAK